MPYTAGAPQAGRSFASIGFSAGGGPQAMQDEFLRRFYAGLAAQGGAGGFPAGGQVTTPAPGAFLNPDIPLVGVGDEQGGQIPPGGAQTAPMSMAGPVAYTRNFGVNALLNSFIKPAGATKALGLGGALGSL